MRDIFYQVRHILFPNGVTFSKRVLVLIFQPIPDSEFVTFIENSGDVSFRYPLRDRLRAVECPSDMIDQIGGWATAGVGQAYGDGYGIDKKWEWLSAIT